MHAVRGIDIDVEHGQFYTMLGPSGCGKTTKLRSVAGLDRPSEGEITIDNQLVYSSDRHLMTGVPNADQENVLEAKEVTAMFMGDIKECRVALRDSPLRLKLHPSTKIVKGASLRIKLPPEHCRALMA